MGAITTHILDISIGRPAAGVPVRLDRQTETGHWEELGGRETDSDGRARDLIDADGRLTAAVHRLTFDVGPYFRGREIDSFYREISIAFIVSDASQHYHVPLLLSPFGYSTYRGS